MPSELMINATEPVDADEDEVVQTLRLASAALRESGYAALTFVSCELQDGELVLEGSVPTYHLKQLAQSFVQRAIGNARVDNRLAVRRIGEARRLAP